MTVVACRACGKNFGTPDPEPLVGVIGAIAPCPMCQIGNRIPFVIAEIPNLKDPPPPPPFNPNDTPPPKRYA